MQTKKAIVTLSIGEKAQEMSKLTHPTFKKYAKKINADFIVIDKPKIKKDFVHFEKYQLYYLLEKYDRIIFFDSDIIIAPECPDLFEVVPEDKFGAFLDSSYTNMFENEIKLCQKSCGDINWKKDYFNVGVLITSKKHKEIFNPNLPIPYISKWFPEQTIINYNVQRLKIPIFDIGIKFNHIDYTKNPKKITRKDYGRFDSYIIHYAGNWKYKENRLNDIKRDLRILIWPKKFRKIVAKSYYNLIFVYNKFFSKYSHKIKKNKKDKIIWQNLKK